MAMFFAAAALLLGSCITDKLSNPAATQSATAIDPATTQPAYYLAKPAVAQIDAGDYDSLLKACQAVARNYGYQLDRLDYRQGLLTTQPMVSKVWFECWRKDAGTARWVWRDSLQTIRRTIRFEIRRDDHDVFHAVPKVLIEEQSILEHRLSSATEYRGAFSGSHTSSLYTTDVLTPVPGRYWTPIDRDTEMEKQLAAAVRDRLTKATTTKP